MPHGYHFYRKSKFDLAVDADWQDQSGQIQITKRTMGPGGFIGHHAISYYLPKDDDVRAGGHLYNKYELVYSGFIWLTERFALLEIRSEVVHSLAKKLNVIDGVELTRLSLPNIKAIYDKLPTKVEVSTRQPDDPNRSRVTVRGGDISKNKTNLEEIQRGQIRHVELILGDRLALVYDGATIMLRNNYEAAVGAELAWDLWRNFLSSHAVDWRGRTRRGRGRSAS